VSGQLDDERRVAVKAQMRMELERARYEMNQAYQAQLAVQLAHGMRVAGVGSSTLEAVRKAFEEAALAYADALYLTTGKP
jgi:hypothetical protein